MTPPAASRARTTAKPSGRPATAPAAGHATAPAGRRGPAPRLPRRVSGPATPATRATPARPGIAGAPALPVSGVTVPKRLRTVLDAPVLDRLTRGRAWIGLVAAGLIGIVFMQVSLLRLNAGIGRSVQSAQALERENAQLRDSISRLGSGDRIQSAGRGHGMVLPPTGTFRYLKSGRSGDVHRALRLMKAPPAGTAMVVPPLSVAPAAPSPSPSPTPAQALPQTATTATSLPAATTTAPAQTTITPPAQTTTPTTQTPVQGTAPGATTQAQGAPGQPTVAAGTSPTTTATTPPTGR